MQDIADRIATAGYLALVPDLYAHGGSRPTALAARPHRRAQAVHRHASAGRPGRRGGARAGARASCPRPSGRASRSRWRPSLPAMDAPDPFVTDLRGAVAHLRDHPDCNGQIGAIGFCLGGGLAGLLACDEPALRAAVAFYGTPPAVRPRRRHRLPDARHLRRQGHAHHRRRCPRSPRRCRRAGKRFDHQSTRARRTAFFNDTRPALPGARVPRRLGAHARLPGRAARLAVHSASGRLPALWQ